MNTGPNPEMTEVAMMTNVPAGRSAGSVISHCQQDGLSHMTQDGSLPQHCFSGFSLFKFTNRQLFLIFTQITSFSQSKPVSSRSFSVQY